MKNLVVFVFIIFSSNLLGQNEFAKHWYVGEGLYFDFNSGNPSIQYNSPSVTFESDLSYSDSNGDVLFYSNLGTINNGGTEGMIWNKNNQVMLNGELGDTCGCQSSYEGGIVIQDFNDPNKYHIYMSDCDENINLSPQDHKGLTRTTIDMSLDNGLGGVITKGESLLGDSTLLIASGISATEHSNGSDYWLIAHGYHYPIISDTFYVFQLTSSGILGPSKQVVGNFDGNARIEISPDGSKLLLGSVLFDFDNSTGIISNPINLPRFTYGKSFSPNSALLYITDGIRLYQYDLTSPNPDLTETLLFEPIDTLNPFFAGLQITPYCEILVGRQNNNLGIIRYANQLGTACNYEHDAIQLANTPSPINFPNFIESEFECETAQMTSELPKEIDIKYSQQKLIIRNNINKTELRIYDLQGRLVLSEYLIFETNYLDVSKLKTGLYLIKIETEEGAHKIYIP